MVSWCLYVVLVWPGADGGVEDSSGGGCIEKSCGGEEGKIDPGECKQTDPLATLAY